MNVNPNPSTDVKTELKPPLSLDPKTIIGQTLAFLHPNGEPFELCIIGPKTPKSTTWEGYVGGKKAIVAGWFKDHDKVAALAPHVQAKGVYVTLNPCQEPLLSRANERLVAQVPRTKDAEISHIRNLLIDVDPGEAVKGISSTDLDHDAALAMAEVIRADLEKEGWPAPLVGDSGNGGHLIYPLDLPPDEESTALLQAVLVGLDRRYADQLAHLHLELYQVVFNPARLTKLYGTWARKGDNTADRPHRLSRIISLPEARTPVSRELLKRIAGCAISQEAPRTKAPVQASGKIDVEAYLARYGQEVSQVKPHGDATLYCLAECIFDSTHTDKEAAIGQAADGKLFYQCFHKSCKGRTWKDARQKISGAAKLGEAKPTQAELLIKLAGDAELFHDMNRKGYATIPVDGHLETWPIKSTAFRDWLRGRFYKAHGKPPGGQALQDALDQLAAQARFDGDEHEVYVRIAHMVGKVFVDLANESWQAVEITPQGWRVVDNPLVKFRHPRGLAPMPPPEPGGNLVDLRPFINCREEDWPLVVAWIIGAFSPGPYPIMIFQGEQGTAKSTTARALKNVLDPGHSPQRTAPRDVRDLMISASNSWSLSFDNLSNLPPWLSDGFCRLATGGGLSTRELYSNDNETILDAMRPVILNGIDSLVSRADLASRAILLELPQIENGRRRPEKDLWKAFEAAQTGILGAVFKAVSAALANVHGVKLPELPRMADFAIWVVAAEPALPWKPGTFLDVYSGNRAAVVEHSLEGDVVAVAVRSFMADRGNLGRCAVCSAGSFRNHYPGIYYTKQGMAQGGKFPK
jgi:hypothetical protein